MENSTYSDFSIKMRDSSRIYNNYNAILEKTDIDGYLNRMYTTVKDILSNEIHFAFGGIINRVKED